MAELDELEDEEDGVRLRVTKAEFDLIQRAKEAGLEPSRVFDPYQPNVPMQGPSDAVM